MIRGSANSRFNDWVMGDDEEHMNYRDDDIEREKVFEVVAI